MADFKDLKLYPNMPPVSVSFVFDTPRSYPSRQNPAEKRYAYRLRLLEDHREYRAGDEVTLWTSNERYVDRLNAFKKGDRVVIQCPQEPGERFYNLVVKPLSMEEGPIYDTPPASGANGGSGPNGNAVVETPNGEIPAPVARMGEAMAGAYEAMIYAGELLAARHGEEIAQDFVKAMTQPEIIQKTGVSLFIQGTR